MLIALRRNRTAIALAGATLLAATPALAGRWIPGGAFDPVQRVATTFLRYLAEDGEGQMTIRCNAADGLTIDVGVAGNGALPAGAATGDEIPVSLAFTADPAIAVDVVGTLFVRQDGAVVVLLADGAAAAVAPALEAGAGRVDVTIGGTTLPIPLETLAPLLDGFTQRCAAWPA
jgi:hypothetical protein